MKKALLLTATILVLKWDFLNVFVTEFDTLVL